MAHLANSLLAKNALRAVVLAVILRSVSPDPDPAQIAGIGGNCDRHNILCPPNADCVSNTCTCNQGFVVVENKCFPEVNEWQGACTNDIQCQKFTNSVCKDGQCQCRANNHYTDGKCWSTKHLGDVCHDNNECLLLPHEDRIECDGICKCKHQYHEEGQECNGSNAVWSLGLISLLFTASLQLLIN